MVDTSCGKMESLEEHEARIGPISVICKGGFQTFAAHFWHSERLDCKKRGIVGSGFFMHQTHIVSMVIACDADMELGAFVRGQWFDERIMIIRIPAADLSTCRSTCPNEVEVVLWLVTGCDGKFAKWR